MNPRLSLPQEAHAGELQAVQVEGEERAAKVREYEVVVQSLRRELADQSQAASEANHRRHAELKEELAVSQERTKALSEQAGAAKAAMESMRVEHRRQKREADEQAAVCTRDHKAEVAKLTQDAAQVGVN
jgi:ABC-type uncharacterized transport system involved in gliding motility auxiliary subunit